MPPPVALAASSDAFTELFDACYDDPTLFFEEVLKARLRGWQHGLTEEIRMRRQAGELHTKLHIRTCHQSGKTFLSAGLVLWWGATRPGSRILTTAPTWKGVEEFLWTEIHKLYYGGLLGLVRLGRMLDVKWDMGSGWFAVGAASDKPANLEGQGSQVAAMRVVDEAKTVTDGVFTATQGMLASPETLDIWISTPSIRSGKFYERDLTMGDELIRKVVTIDDLIRDGVPGKQHWKDECLLEYGGEQSFEYRSRAMAEYIDDSEGALIPFSWIERAMDSPKWGLEGRPTLGYDVAGSVDGDENAVAVAIGPVQHPTDERLVRYEIVEVEHWHQRDTMVSKDRALTIAKRTDARCIRADVQGLGKGVCDAIARERSERGLPLFVEEYRSADPAEDTENFLNLKAENEWVIRRLFEKDLIRLPKDNLLRKQIAAMKYEVRNGKIRVVDPPKSPDLWDAVVMAIGGVYRSFAPKDIYGGGENEWGPKATDSAWTRTPGEE